MTRPPLATTIASLLGATVVLQPIISTVAQGQAAQSQAQRELARRQQREQLGRQAIREGARAMREKDYEQAVAQYKLAVDNIPNAPATRASYADALDGFSRSSVRLAEQRITEGRYADAENLLRLVLSEQYNPRYRDAIVLLSRLEEPDYFNRTITPGHRARVEDVKKYLIEAQGFYDTGRYDMAFRRTEQVLNVDPYNIAARKMQEKINLQKSNFGNTAYNERRSRSMAEIDLAWQSPVRQYGRAREEIVIRNESDAQGTARNNQKLARIIIPKLELREATVREAIEFLRQKSVQLDTTESDPSRKGVNIVLKLDGAGMSTGAPVDSAPPAAAIPGLEVPGLPPAVPDAPAGGASADTRITVSLSNIPLGEALKYVTNLAGLKYKVEPFAISVVPQSAVIDVLITKQYKVRPGFITRVASSGGDASGLLAPTPSDATRGGSGIASRMDAKEFLTSVGVKFPEGASATYMSSTSQLIVRNTQENIDLIDTLVDADSQQALAAAQVEIEAKFVEISQNNLKELSFDWLLGQANVPGSPGSVFVGGGTSGTSPQLNPADYGFIAPGGQPVGQFPVTAANRSGSLAISQNAIDALLFGVQGNSQLAPGVLSLSGVFTDPQFQLVIRALNQKKGVDLLSAPKVTTKSGQRAVIEIIREFRYPTEFDPPQIPQNFGNDNNGGGFILGGGVGGLNPLAAQSQSSFPVTPTTPTAFETRNTGVTLEVEPVIGPDGTTIDLNLVPQVVEFEGFINYGSPIQTTSTNALGQQIVNVITPNVINQPIFSTRKVTTSVSIFNGATVTLGGLIREDVQKVEDKIPFLGDIPLVGRLFRSNVDQHLKRNLVIFVTARLINAAGEPVGVEEEEEEIVETLPMPEVGLDQPLPLMPK